LTDRERRLQRAWTRLGIAARLIDEAAWDYGACVPERAETCLRLARRVKWMAAQVGRALREVGGMTDTIPTDSHNHT
jgi:hypothetical protein